MSKYAIDLSLYPDCRHLVEEAGSLIKKGKRPTITFGRGVNFAVRSKQPFKGYRLQLSGLYSDPCYATGICLHEGAHGLMMEENGERNVRFFGPDISFGNNGALFPSAARVGCDPRPETVLTEELILQTTILLVVGGVAMEKYSGIREISDKKDYDDFLEKYNATPPGYFKEEPKDFWKRAQGRASEWADVSATKTKVFEKASEYLHLLYP
jgi:hypothetical protein